MLNVVLLGHEFNYEIGELLKLFYEPDEFNIIRQENYNEKIMLQENKVLLNRLTQKDNVFTACSSFFSDGKLISEYEEKEPFEFNSQIIKKKSKNLIKRSLVKLIEKQREFILPWGILTGVRPTKIVHELLEKTTRDTDIKEILKHEYLIQEDKIKLLIDVAKKEFEFLYPVDEEKISIYISIPFCPSRCAYCSFPSNSIEKYGQVIDDYIHCLEKEIAEIFYIAENKGLKAESVYIGGGTPAVLNINQLERLFEAIYRSIDKSHLKELTFEGGRPDAMDYEKLVYLKRQGVTRISINPQSMDESTLNKIGRKHTASEVLKAYEAAEKAGFNNINMDIIIGLPGETEAMVSKTMEEIEKLSPASLTVHTLAVKNTSLLKEQNFQYGASRKDVLNMLAVTQEYAKKMGLNPYYLYRQKHMAGNLENVGYSKTGCECIYNIQIMGEKQTILAAGAGAVSKIVFPEENRIERVPNVKNLNEYINRADEMMERKKKFFADIDKNFEKPYNY